MGLPIESVQAEVRKAGRISARSITRVIAGEQGAQRSSWSSAALSGNSATTSAPAP